MLLGKSQRLQNWLAPASLPCKKVVFSTVLLRGNFVKDSPEVNKNAFFCDTES